MLDLNFFESHLGSHMDQQQHELRQAAAQAFMESLDLLENYLHTAESPESSESPELTPELTSESIAQLPGQSLGQSPGQSPITATTKSRMPPSPIDRPYSTSIHLTDLQDTHPAKPAIDAQSKMDQRRTGAIEPRIDLQALEEAVADIEQFMNDSDGS